MNEPIRRGACLCFVLLFVLPACGGRQDRAQQVRPATVAQSSECSLGIGRDHACAACAGQVICWGNNRFGQLGRGTSTQREGAATVEGLRDIVEVAVGAKHSCARRADGALYCWGANVFGELGDGTRQFRLTPRRVAVISDAVDLDLARHRSCAVRRSGEVWCWGRVHDEPATVWTRPMPTDERGDAVQVALGTEHACVRRRDGTIACWGEIVLNSDEERHDQDWLSVRELEGPDGALRDAVAIASGGDSSCALTSGGIVYCWGELVRQQALVAQVQAQASGDVWRVASIPDAVQLEAGLSLVCARTQTGKVQCMGPGARGVQDVPMDRPVAVFDIADAAAISLADEVGCIQRRTGALECWGRHSDVFLETVGQGPAALGQRVAGLDNVRAIDTGEHLNYAVRRDGTALCWGRVSPRQLVGLTDVQEIVGPYDRRSGAMCARHRNGTVSCWRSNTARCDAQHASSASLKRGLVDAAALGAGFEHTCALRSNGTVVCWGDNGGGRLGVAGGAGSEDPVAVPGLTGVEELAVGSTFACARRGGEVSCWGDWTGGDSRFEALPGLGSDMPPTVVAGIHDAVQLVAGIGYACVRTAQGTVLCWGHNDYGSLGGETSCGAQPTAVPGIDSATILWGRVATNCARLRSGEVRCWGYNGNGGYGYESGMVDPDGERFVYQPVPVAVGADAEIVAPAASEICVTTTNGEVRCWSAPSDDGEGTPETVPTPVQVVGVTLRGP